MSETNTLKPRLTQLSDEQIARVHRDSLDILASVVYVHEMIDQRLRLPRGFPLDDAAVGLEEIAQTGPGAHFSLTGQTRRHYCTAYYTSAIFPRWSIETWQAWACPRPGDVFRRHTARLLESLGTPQDHDDLITWGGAWIKAR